MSRETIIRCTVATSLEWAPDGTERAVDRVTALGLGTIGNDLGSSVAHAEALDPAAIRNVILILSRNLTRTLHLNRGYAVKISVAALSEYMHLGCPTCGGLGNHFYEGKLVTSCTRCNGSGLHRHSDTERARNIGGKYPQKAYETALGMIRDAMAGAVSGTNKHLYCSGT